MFIRYRTTLTQDRMAHNQSEDLTSLRRPSQYHHRTSSSFTHRPLRCNTSAFRRGVYSSGIHVVTPVGAGTIHTDTSSLFYARNPACTHRLVPWLNRELNVLLDGELVDVYQVLQEILSLIQQVCAFSNIVQNKIKICSNTGQY